MHHLPLHATVNIVSPLPLWRGAVGTVWTTQPAVIRRLCCCVRIPSVLPVGHPYQVSAHTHTYTHTHGHTHTRTHTDTHTHTHTHTYCWTSFSAWNTCSKSVIVKAVPWYVYERFGNSTATMAQVEVTTDALCYTAVVCSIY